MQEKHNQLNLTNNITVQFHKPTSVQSVSRGQRGVQQQAQTERNRMLNKPTTDRSCRYSWAANRRYWYSKSFEICWCRGTRSQSSGFATIPGMKWGVTQKSARI